ncbi:hypothetical protein Hamer_G031315 [Homarus americanus]|uniref:Uncharacterized protein n=1 Tax=Homarus americanus TaxID=6706 RepID=A0A8J5MNE3_HOMAM|nr:hypothetical protein Hamer_G031315 [Homarus americanus]
MTTALTNAYYLLLIVSLLFMITFNNILPVNFFLLFTICHQCLIPLIPVYYFCVLSTITVCWTLSTIYYCCLLDFFLLSTVTVYWGWSSIYYYCSVEFGYHLLLLSTGVCPLCTITSYNYILLSTVIFFFLLSHLTFGQPSRTLTVLE